MWIKENVNAPKSSKRLNLSAALGYSEYSQTCCNIKSILGHQVRNQTYLSSGVRKPDFCLGENRGADQIRSNCEADHCLCFFATLIVQILFFLNLKFQASSLLLRLHRLVCVRPGRKPRRPVFSCRSSYNHRRKSGHANWYYVMLHDGAQ